MPDHGNLVAVHATDSSDSFPAGPYVVRVYWRTGRPCRGGLDIALPPALEDPLTAAEIVAARHLLGEKAVLGWNRSGRGLTIVCSRGAVRKVAREVSTKRGLYRFAHPLMTRYADARIVVDKDRSWLPRPERLAALPVEALDGAAFGDGPESCSTRTLGTVAVTRHALERYIGREVPLGRSAAWRSLIRRLDSGLVRVELPEKVRRWKSLKYGAAARPVEVWKHPDSTLHYVFLAEADRRLLVTVFNRREM